MPLSENEQRILRQIEQQLERDPSFSTRGYHIPRRRVVLLSLALISVLGLTVLALTVSVWLSIVGFVGSVALAVLLEGEVRLLLREKVGQLPVSAWLGGGQRAKRGQPGQRARRHDDE